MNYLRTLVNRWPVKSRIIFCHMYGRQHFSLRIWSQLQKKFLMENFIYCAVFYLFLALYHTATFSATQYLSYLHQGPAIRFHILCLSQKSGEIFVREILVFLSRPALAFEQFPSYWKKGQEMQFVVRVKNPLKVELTDCVLRLDGNLMEGRLTLPQR